MTDSLSAILAAIGPVIEPFISAHQKLYLVGGVVRDLYLGRLRSDEADIDLTTGARPELIKELLGPAADAVWAQGERFGTIGCHIGSLTLEITTHRADAYEAGSRKPVVEFGDTLHDDLARRDFTANAMAIDVTDPTAPIIDPFNGRADLDQAVLRTPSAPDVSFSDDPLRMMRAARFMAGYNLEPVPEMVASVRSNTERMTIVSRERIRDEFEKLILLDSPIRGLEFLATSGLMAHVLRPDGGASISLLDQRLRQLPKDPAARWAAVVVDRPGWKATLRDLRLANLLVNDVARLVAAAEAVCSLDDVDASRLRRLVVAGVRRDDVDGFVRVVHATKPESPVRSVTAVVEAWDALAAHEDLDALGSPLNGDEIQQILDVEPGRLIGAAKSMLSEASVERGPLSKAAAAEILQGWTPGSGS